MNSYDWFIFLFDFPIQHSTSQPKRQMWSRPLSTWHVMIHRSWLGKWTWAAEFNLFFSLLENVPSVSLNIALTKSWVGFHRIGSGIERSLKKKHFKWICFSVVFNHTLVPWCFKTGFSSSCNLFCHLYYFLVPHLLRKPRSRFSPRCWEG